MCLYVLISANDPPIQSNLHVHLETLSNLCIIYPEQCCIHDLELHIYIVAMQYLPQAIQTTGC